MSTEIRSRSKRTLLRLLIFIGVVGTGLAVASAVFAGWTTISFSNGAIDTAAWTTTANYSDANNSASINDRDEISKAWVKYDGTNFYFRIDTIGSPALSSTNNRAVAGLDCNHNGTFNDRIINGPDGDRLIIYSSSGVNMYGYNTSGALTFVGAVNGDFSDASGASIEWGVPLYLLYPGCRGSVAGIGVGWSTATGAGAAIDQSSTSADVSDPMDYGDAVQTLPAPPATCSAPDTATGLQCNGARHGIVPMTPGVPLRFGSEAVDADPGNLQSGNSDADDTSGTTPNDEQGIYPDPADSWSDGTGTLDFTIVGAASARVGCWIDFNKNGVWTDAGEVVINNAPINSATTSRNITIPGGLTWSNSFPARCRIWQNPVAGTPTPVPAPNGPIEFGEVEDHIWNFDSSGNYIAPGAPSAVTGLAIAASGTNDVTLTWTNPAPNDGARVLGHATNPYFTSANSPFVVDQLDSAAPWQFVHAGIRGTPADTLYYIVYGRYGSTEATTPSNRVGLFEFGLTPGQ